MLLTRFMQDCFFVILSVIQEKIPHFRFVNLVPVGIFRLLNLYSVHSSHFPAKCTVSLDSESDILRVSPQFKILVHMIGSDTDWTIPIDKGREVALLQRYTGVLGFPIVISDWSAGLKIIGVLAQVPLLEKLVEPARNTVGA